jgi:hypothetical protein
VSTLRTTALGGLPGTAKRVGLGIAAGIGAAGVAVGGLAVSSASAAADMETQMSNIAAVMNKPLSEIEPLNSLIKELGLDPGLKVDAVQAGQAIEMLAKNGLTMQEVLDGAAHSTVLLANSTGADFATAADIGTDAMAIFGISAENMSEAVNGITSVTTNSKFDVNDYGLALAQAGGVASAAGVEFADFNAAITAMSPLFASGSDAGTSFKTMLTRLTPASDAAWTAMSELGIIGFNSASALEYLTAQGIEVEGGLSGAESAFWDYTAQMKMSADEQDALIESLGLMTNKFYDSEGNLQSMGTIAGVLQESLAGLNEEQKTMALQTIFGADAMRAAVGLADTGADAFSDLQSTMGQTNALDSAATRMNNLSGQLEIIEGVIETIKLSFGQALMPIIRLVADAMLNFAENVLPTIEAALGTVSEIITSFVGNLSEGMSPLDAFIEAIWDIAPQELLDKLIMLRDEILPGLVAWFSENIQPIIDMVTEFVSWQDVLTGLGIAITVGLMPVIGGLIGSILMLAAPIAAAIAIVALMRTAWEEDWGGIQGKVSTAVEFIRNLIETVFGGIKEFWDTHGADIVEIATTNWELVQTAINKVVTFIRDEIIVPVMTALQAFWEEHGAAILESAEGIWQSISDFIGGIFDTIKELQEAFAAAFEGDWETFGAKIYTAFETHINNVISFFGNLWESIQPLIDSLWTSIQTWFTETDWMELGQQIIDGLVESIRNGAVNVGTAIRDMVRGAIGAARDEGEIRSPSRAFFRIGEYMNQGLALALQDNSAVVSAMQESMAGLQAAAYTGASIDQSQTTYNRPMNIAFNGQQNRINAATNINTMRAMVGGV